MGMEMATPMTVRGYFGFQILRWICCLRRSYLLFLFLSIVFVEYFCLDHMETVFIYY